MVGMGWSDTRADESSLVTDTALDDIYGDVMYYAVDSFNGGSGARKEQKKPAEAKEKKKPTAESWEISFGTEEKRKEKDIPICKARFAMAKGEKFEKGEIKEMKKAAAESWAIPASIADEKQKKKVMPMAKARIAKDIAEKAEIKEKERDSKYKKEDFLHKSVDVSWRVAGPVYGEARKMKEAPPRKAEREEKRRELEEEGLKSMR